MTEKNCHPELVSGSHQCFSPLNFTSVPGFPIWKQQKIITTSIIAENYRWLEYEGNWFDYFHNLLDSKPIEPTKETIYCHYFDIA